MEPAKDADASTLDELLDMLGVLRYGVPTADKERAALTHALPGAPPVVGADAAEAQRYAAGFLHGKTFPRASRASVPVAAFLRALFLNESPELQSFAQHGANVGRIAEE